MLVLRSLLFNLLLWVSVFVWGSLSLLTFPLPALVRYRVITRWTHFNMWTLRVICRLDFRVEGAQHIPDRPAIIFAKHQSSWETLALQLIFPPQVWVLKRELLRIPFFGWALALLDPIAIDRRGGRRALDQIVQQGRQRLQTGRWVVVFPEGTRMPPGEQGRFGVGGAVLAARTGHPVVPVVHDAGRFWPRGGFIKRPGTVRVVIGPPIDASGRAAADINRQAEAWMRQAMAALEAGEHAPKRDVQQLSL